MVPYIFIGPMPIPTYGLMCVTAYIAGILFGLTRAKTYGYPKDIVLYSGIFAAIGAIAGAKLLYFITSLPGFIRDYDLIVENDMDGLFVMQYLFGGFVFYGGLIGALAMFMLFCRIFKLNFLCLSNIIAPVIPLIHGIGRIGCFLGGCCYGIEYHGPFAIHFHYNELVLELSEVPRFPVQLLEAGINIMLFIILYIYSGKKRKDGEMLGIYLICYSIIRFSLEFLRGDTVRGAILNVSTSQWISLLLIPAGIALIIHAHGKEKKNTAQS